MAMQFPSTVIVIFYLSGAALSADYYGITSPLFIIYPTEEEIAINAREDVSFMCKGKHPIAWTTPRTSDMYEESSSEIIETFNNAESSKYKHSSTLQLKNASYSDTGYYYCHSESSNEHLQDGRSVAKIYLYVSDDEHLSVITTSPTIEVPQYETVVIPCRPTHPDIKVELHILGGEQVTDAFYSPRVGFKFETDKSALYICIFTKGDTEYEIPINTVITPRTYGIEKPVLEDLSKGHTVRGETLTIKCSVSSIVPPDIDIVAPRGDVAILGQTTKEDSGWEEYSRILTINDTSLEDKGIYSCIVKDRLHKNNNSIFVNIHDVDDHFIELTEENNMYSIDIQENQDVQWVIKVIAHPIPQLRWENNQKKTIEPNNPKYYFHNSHDETLLQIKNVSIFDSGTYTLVADNSYEKISLDLFLNVTGKPSTRIKSEPFHMFDDVNVVSCTVQAYPTPSIRWYFKPCLDDNCSYEAKEAWMVKQQKDGLHAISFLNITSDDSGYLKCFAENDLGFDESVAEYYVTDVRFGFNVWGLDDIQDKNTDFRETIVAEGEKISIFCGATISKFSDDINWFKDSMMLTNSTFDDFSLQKKQTRYSYQLELIIDDVKFEDAGIYSCRNQEKFIDLSVKVSESWGPIINETNMYEEVKELSLRDTLELFCKSSGLPRPQIKWYKDNVEFEPGIRATFDEKDQVLIFSRNEPEDEGIYKCMVFNSKGSTYQEISIKFTDKPGLNATTISIICVLVIGLLVAFIIILCTVIKEKRLRKQLREAGLDNFEKGALESLNPDLRVDDQAELLPYDKKYEFPRDKLKLGKQLGAGAFGVVMKAKAFGITDGEDSTIVAVKMVKRNADYTYIKALASELKIMIHLGKHLNVVNLLGACTKNVVKRELLVIVEYCRYGNLHNYLQRHRGQFISQIDPETGQVDYTIGAEILERTFSISSEKSGHSGYGRDVDYKAMSSYSGRTANTEMTDVCMTPTAETDTKGYEGAILSNNSIQPEWRSNYRGDYKGEVKPICTKDLLVWAFQVARGMEYLASRRVLHGDLAARNILLADDGIVKICDFGLAKSMYQNDNYKKKGDAPLPFKWMAIESIRDRVFSTQSDVWSFGIVLWEFFSLARSPYPGMEANEQLYHKLVDGYRMGSPDYATKEIYCMMLDCWKSQPVARPSFARLAERIGSVLEDNIRNHYIDLNDPYLKMNTQRLQEGQSDYLAMLSPPDIETITSPRIYVNDVHNIEDQPAGYLCMKPSSIFSPREVDENVFNFDNSKVKPEANELMPMLNVQSDSDAESPLSPAGVKSVSNPTYQVLTKIDEKPKRQNEILKSKDNYVNMPQNKSAIISEDKVKHDYVNNESMQTCM